MDDLLSLAKGVPLAAYPVFAIMAVCAAVAALSLTRWWRIGLVLLGSALIALWIAATPVFANWLNLRLESELPAVSVETLPQSDVVILLGGATPDLDDPGNRIMHALRVYRAGKAPIIIISGGNQLFPDETIADHLVVLGLPRSAVIVDMKSRNTRENAVNTAAIFKAHGWRGGILVTSSTHMPRALAAFQKAGLSVAPAPTGIQTPPPRFASGLDLRMDKEALLRTTAALKEMIGLWTYRFLGWA